MGCIVDLWGEISINYEQICVCVCVVSGIANPPSGKVALAKKKKKRTWMAIAQNRLPIWFSHSYNWLMDILYSFSPHHPQGFICISEVLFLDLLYINTMDLIASWSLLLLFALCWCFHIGLASSAQLWAKLAERKTNSRAHQQHSLVANYFCIASRQQYLECSEKEEAKLRNNNKTRISVCKNQLILKKKYKNKRFAHHTQEYF